MEQSRITLLTRRGIKEPKPVAGGVSDSEIEETTILGVYHFGIKIKALDPSFYNTRKSLQALKAGFIFAKPSDCLTVLRIWDLGGNAGAITAASNTSPIVVTSASHGFADNAIVTIHDVLGNTSANGTWQITYIDADSFSLDGSVGNAAYTSGGLCYEEPVDPQKIGRINLEEGTNANDTAWYPRASNIIVDHKEFTNDVLIDYIRSPSAITDIPAEYHYGLVAFNIIQLILIPRQEDKDYEDKIASLQRAQQNLKTVEGAIKTTFKVSGEPTHFSEEFRYEDYMA